MNDLNININIDNKNKNKSIEEIIDILSLEFQQKPLESDFLLSLFYTTIFHRKSYILCNPFPPSFIDIPTTTSTTTTTIQNKTSTITQPQKNFESLRSAFSQLPNVNSLSNKEILSKLSHQTLQALYFILKSSDGISVKFIDYKKFERKHGFLKDSPDHLKISHKPSFVFKVKYNVNNNNNDNSFCSSSNNNINCSNNNNNSNNNNSVLVSSYHEKRHRKFKELGKEKGSMLGYHGSANENWFNIIKGRGFSHQFVSEECLFGKGFYFSSDSKVSTTFIKWGGNGGSSKNNNNNNNNNNNISELWWPNSMWAKKKIGFLSACTLINTIETARGIEVMATNHHQSPHVFTEKDRSLPPCYILADNSEDIRVKYMLLFSEDISNNSSKNNNIKQQNTKPILINQQQQQQQHQHQQQHQRQQPMIDINRNSDDGSSNDTFIQRANNANDSIMVKLRPLFRFLMVVLVVFAAHFLLNTFKTASKKSSISHKGVFY
ncbi:hypothetical protein ACTFIY_002375 [Dictyostelium cf. discoideum]